MARARKLFPIYGSALANGMLVTLGRERVVHRFVAAYEAEYNRRGILGEPARDRELADTMGREILLAMIVETQEALPGFFGKKQKSKLKSEERESIEAFSAEALAALSRAQNWNAEDRKQFLRDLELYTEFSARKETKSKSPKGKKMPEEETPFIARVALLLDPSMLEQARRAARKLHGSVRLLARKLLRHTLSPGRR
jgi:hypothetical protein